MKRVFGILTLITFIISNSFAQDVEALPDDPRVMKGTLANGLSYILIKNKDEKGFAHFGIAQKIGTSLEEKNQKGMFKMLEALTVKGTRNFTDSTITQYLRSIGLTTKDVVFDTDKDNITYVIKNVPVSKGKSVDSSLLILYNWLGSINIDEEDIKEEAAYVKNSLLYSWNAEKRMDDRLLNELYPDSMFATNLKADDIAHIDNFTSKELRNFYYKWFRSDFQAIVVVGDIDLNVMKTRVESIFATIPKPMDKLERTYYTPEAFDGAKAIVLKDKEYDKTKVSIDILKAPLTPVYKRTSVPFIQEYMDNAISTLLSNRLREGIISKNLPISNLSVGKGKFMNIHNQDAFTITFETLPDMVYSAISFVNSEIGKMARYGFNGQEFGRSKDIYFRELSNLYDNRSSVGNQAYFDRALNHYYYGFSLASIELKFEIMKEILFTISLNQLNQYANAMLGQKDNIVISCKMPEYSGIDGITPERVLAAYYDAGLSTPTIQPAATIVSWPEFIAKEGSAASVVSQTKDPLTDATVLTLSNGATVVFKNTQSDTVSVKAVSKGGFSLMSGVNFGNERYINDILSLGGLGNFSKANMDRLYSYYHMNLSAKIGQNTEELYGYSDTTNVEKLFHAIHMAIENRRADEDAFKIYMKEKTYEASYRNLSPGNIFKDSILYYNFSNKNYVKRLAKEDIEKIRYSNVLGQAAKRFSNAADFVFIFAGKIDEPQYIEYAVKYIGSIKGNSATKEEWRVVPNYLTKGNISKRFLCRMVTPRTYSHVTRSYGMRYNIDNYVMSQMLEVYLKNVLDNRNTKRIATNSNLNVNLRYFPEEILTIETAFETDSAHASGIVESVENALNDVASKELSAEQFDKYMNTLKDNFARANAGNEYWLGVIEQRYMNGNDFHSGYVNALGKITPKRFKEFVKGVVTKGNRISVIMDGTTEDVNTQNLFKEDTFIKEFFNIN